MTVSPAVSQTRIELVRALGEHNLVLTDTQAPVRPAESPLLGGGPTRGLPGHPAEGPDPRLHRRLRIPRSGPARLPRRRSSRRTWRPGRGASRRRSGRSRSSARSARRSSSTNGCRRARPTIRRRGSSRRSRRSAWGSRSRAERHAAARPQATGRGVSAAIHARTWPRLILSVCVRGKSSSGHSRQPAIRWFGPSVALAALTAASMRARELRGLGGLDGARRACRRAEDDRLDAAGLGLDDDQIADAGDAQRVLDVLGIDVEAVGQHDDVLDPARQDQPAARRRGGRCRRSGTSRRR